MLNARGSRTSIAALATAFTSPRAGKTAYDDWKRILAGVNMVDVHVSIDRLISAAESIRHPLTRPALTVSNRK